jgi:hypothetical protein
MPDEMIEAIIGWLPCWMSPIVRMVSRRWARIVPAHICDCDCDGEFAVSLSKAGEWTLLRWAVDAGCPLGSLVIDLAAERGDIPLLEAMERRTGGGKRSAGAAFDGVCEAAVRGERMDALMWARERGYPWGCAYLAAGKRRSPSMMRLLADMGCPVDPRGVAELLRAGFGVKGLPPFRPTKECRVAAAERGLLHVLVSMDPNAKDWGSATTLAAARGGSAYVLSWAVTRGCGFRPIECTRAAAANGHLAVLDWVRREGYYISSGEVTETAARTGYVHVVEWAIRNLGRQGVGRAVRGAVEGDRPEVLEWLECEGMLKRQRQWKKLARLAVDMDAEGVLLWLEEVCAFDSHRTSG